MTKFLDVTGEARKEVKEIEKPKKPLYDWRFENNINSGKEPIDLETQGFKYEPWRTNTSLSNHIDTLFYSNLMNINYNVSNKMHYDYLFYSVRKSKRFSKKKTELDKQLEKQYKEEQDNIRLIQEFYKYNYTKSKQVLKILSDDQLETIRKKLEKG
jgi:hypothetical protein